MDFNINAQQPAWRARLQAAYDQAYAGALDPTRETLSFRMQTPDGMREATATALASPMIKAGIPNLDEWAAHLQQQLPSLLSESTQQVAQAQQALDHLQQHGPDAPAGVDSTFSVGGKLLGYINQDGTVVNHAGGEALAKVAAQADALRLSGAQRVAYIREHGQRALSARQPDVQVQTYSAGQGPSNRQFSEQWYPGTPVDQTHQDSVAQVQALLAQALQQQQALQDSHRQFVEALTGISAG